MDRIVLETARTPDRDRLRAALEEGGFAARPSGRGRVAASRGPVRRLRRRARTDRGLARGVANCRSCPARRRARDPPPARRLAAHAVAWSSDFGAGEVCASRRPAGRTRSPRQSAGVWRPPAPPRRAGRMRRARDHPPLAADVGRPVRSPAAMSSIASTHGVRTIDLVEARPRAVPPARGTRPRAAPSSRPSRSGRAVLASSDDSSSASQATDAVTLAALGRDPGRARERSATASGGRRRGAPGERPFAASASRSDAVSPRARSIAARIRRIAGCM